MLISRNWLQEYFDKPIPSGEELADLFSLHAFEVEGVEKVEDDEIIDIDVLPNRSHDCLSHNGVARELAVLLDMEHTQPELKSCIDKSIKSSNYVVLDPAEDPHFVPRMTKRVVMDVKVKQSPEWVKKRLEVLGHRSINTVVDVTNLVMLETGQPVHAFDFDKLADDADGMKHITVRNAKKGEKVTTLDGDTYEREGMLVVADSEKALDIAGIKGGDNSGIDEKTQHVVLSVCNFNQVHIRRTSHELGLITDASKRFGNGLTPELPAVAMARASQLLSEIAGGRVAVDVLDSYPKDLARTAAPYKAGISLKEINKILGTNLQEDEVTSILGRLTKHAGFDYRVVNPLEKVLEYAPTLVGKPYKWGASVQFDAPESFDCSSFVNHVFVQAGIATPRMTVDQFIYGEAVDSEDLLPGDVIFSLNDDYEGAEKAIHVDRLGEKKVSGSQRKETKDFLPGTPIEEPLDHNGIYLGDGKVIHITRRNEDGVMIEDIKESKAFKKLVGFRRMILDTEERFVLTIPYERLDLRAGNGFLVQGNKEDIAEEIGRIHGYTDLKPVVLDKQQPRDINKLFYYSSKIRDILVDAGFSEVSTYTLVEKGEVKVANPFASDKAYMRGEMATNLRKSVEQGVYHKDLLGTDKVNIFEIGTVFTDDDEHIALGIAGDKADLLEVQDLLTKSLGVSVPGTMDGDVMEVDITDLLHELPDPASMKDLKDIDTSGVVFKPFSQYPSISRDLAIWCPEGVPPAQALGIVRESARGLLVNSWQFDEYKKEGRVSYAFRLVFQSYEKTLSDEEVNRVMDIVADTIKRQGWEVR